ncbi:hypothetical protein BC833DRAFT_564336 [Globomyces pollinis-pini]|nr:hypothetical protein BC833DRAFT_564336 [Globomyces pollinis-pini]
MRVADSTASGIHCEGKGELIFTSQLQFTDVIYCPNVKMNLLSVAQFTDLGCIVTFDRKQCTVTEETTNKVLMMKKEIVTYISMKEQHTDKSTLRLKECIENVPISSTCFRNGNDNQFIFVIEDVKYSTNPFLDLNFKLE